ncbi:MAG TPA: tetratricopeptide repeat protein [Acidobacteriaceae bacterium]
MWRAVILAVCPLLLCVALQGQSADLFASRAQEDITAGRYPQAEEDLSRAVAADPTNWKLWNNLGVVRIQLGESESAIKAFERARRLAPQEASAYFDLGFAYMKTSDYEKALEAYRGGLARNPNDVVANQNYAFLLTRDGDFRDAVEPLKRLKSLQPDDVPTRATLIEMYLKAGMKNEGEDETGQLLSAHLATMQEELSLAQLLLGDGEGNAAAEVLSDAKATWPDAAEPHGDLGLLLMRRQQYEAAVGELGRAAQLDPSSAKFALGLGEALLRWRHDTIALQYLLAVQDRFQQLPLYNFELGLSYYYLTRFADALPKFESVAQNASKSSQVQYLLGGTYQALGQLDKAEQCFREAIALKPDEPEYDLVLATLLKKVHPADLTEPVQLAEKGLALSPENADLKLVLASCYQLQGKLPEAQTLLEGVLAYDPNFREAHVALAKVYFRQNRMEDAEKQESIAAKLEERKQSEISPWGPGGVAEP